MFRNNAVATRALMLKHLEAQDDVKRAPLKPQGRNNAAATRVLMLRHLEAQV